jgi:hypothetical protein
LTRYKITRNKPFLVRDEGSEKITRKKKEEKRNKPLQDYNKAKTTHNKNTINAEGNEQIMFLSLFLL